MPPNLDLAIRSVLAAVRSGELTQARIDASVRRILQLKWRRGLVDDPLVDLDEMVTVVGSHENRELADRLAARPVSASRVGR
jgi:beta-N-acetylhexosaminidase